MSESSNASSVTTEPYSSFASSSQSNQSADNQAKMALLSGGNKQWTTVAIPHNYIGSSWPIRFTAMDDGCEGIAVAGRTGFAHYTINNRCDFTHSNFNRNTIENVSVTTS